MNFRTNSIARYIAEAIARGLSPQMAKAEAGLTKRDRRTSRYSSVTKRLSGINEINKRAAQIKAGKLVANG